jgi:hypothetical protein
MPPTIAAGFTDRVIRTVVPASFRTTTLLNVTIAYRR